jgi:hypothetical protein
MQELRSIVAGTMVESPDRYRRGARVVAVPAAAGAPAPAAALVEALALDLYQQDYCRPRLPTPSGDEDLTERLSAANRGRERWDGGWIIEAADPGGRVLVRRGEERRWLEPGRWVSNGGGVAAGATVRIHWPAESRSLQPGFYFALGEALPDADEGAELIRFYWNVGADAAPRLLELLTGELNRLQVPFRLKCLNRRALFARADSAILYLHRRYYAAAVALAAEVHRELGASLGAQVPLFTKRLARGLALAEDPVSRDSFGIDRCRRLASGLYEAWEAGTTGEEDRLIVVLERLRADGLDPERLYLNPGAADLYELPFDWDESRQPSAHRALAGTRRQPAAPGAGDDGTRTGKPLLLHAAAGIGARLCRDAFWAGGRCTWLGPSMEHVDGSWQVAERAFGPDLYAGTSGIALFLAHLHARTGE